MCAVKLFATVAHNSFWFNEIIGVFISANFKSFNVNSYKCDAEQWRNGQVHLWVALIMVSSLMPMARPCQLNRERYPLVFEMNHNYSYLIILFLLLATNVCWPYDCGIKSAETILSTRISESLTSANDFYEITFKPGHMLTLHKNATRRNSICLNYTTFLPNFKHIAENSSSLACIAFLNVTFLDQTDGRYSFFPNNRAAVSLGSFYAERFCNS